MPPELAATARPFLTGLHLPAPWRGAALRLGLVWAALLALFADDWRDMALQWWDSSTYNHILLVPLIVGWLAWQRAGQMAQMQPRAWWPGVALFAAAALLWLLGAFAGFSTARQLGVVAMLVASVPALLGPRIAAAQAFPLAYMALLVPFGEELVPQLQMITAGLTIALVKLSGIPAVIDGVFIDTPAGLFEVAEACSGVKFLIAMVAFGLLVANVCFASWKRRIVFFGLCLVVPVLANGVRAWGTVFAAQYVGAETASGIDHLIYGWVFFALVIALVIAASWRFFDRAPDAVLVDADRLAAMPWLARLERLALAPLLAMGLIGAALAAVMGWAHLADRLQAEVPQQVFLPDVPGWKRVDYAPRLWWEPRAHGARHRLLGRYADGQGRTVDVFFAIYSAQHEGAEASGFGQGGLTPDSAWSWQSPGPAAPGAQSDRLLGEGRFGRVVQTSYRHGDLLTGSKGQLKLALMADKLSLRERPTMLLILSAEESAGQGTAEALQAFRKAAGPLDQWMDRMAGLR